MSHSVAISGVGFYIPGIENWQQLVNASSDSLSQEVNENIDPAGIIGRRGWRFKDKATRISLCSAFLALQDAGFDPNSGKEETSTWGDATGVVMSSSLSNIDTLEKVCTTLNEEGYEALSVMDLPNASPNMAAASVAMRYGLKAPNLMVTQFSGGGIEALHTATRCILAGRAQRMVVIGTEVSHPILAQLFAQSPIAGLENVELKNISVALVLESSDTCHARGAKAQAKIDLHSFNRWSGDTQTREFAEHIGEGGFWISPGEKNTLASKFSKAVSEIREEKNIAQQDFSSVLPLSLGAEGILGVAYACQSIASHDFDRVLVSSGCIYESALNCVEVGAG